MKTHLAEPRFCTIHGPEKAAFAGVVGLILINFQTGQRVAVQKHVRSTAEGLEILCPVHPDMRSVLSKKASSTEDDTVTGVSTALHERSECFIFPQNVECRG
jgi:hypothetical protein